jgi:hypothetical protein
MILTPVRDPSSEIEPQLNMKVGERLGCDGLRPTSCLEWVLVRGIATRCKFTPR